MAADHLSILTRLNRINLELREAQAWVSMARRHHPYDQLLQLELDRKQTEIDDERKEVAELMMTIPLSN